MAQIDPTARVAETARLADDVEIGPFCVVGPQVELAAGVRLVSHVSVTAITRIGEGTIVHPFCALGGPPQSLAHGGEVTKLVVGRNCTIHESVTMNAGTVAGGGITTVGDRGYFMACSHVGHDSQVGNDVIFANGVLLGGHSVIGDHVFMSGVAATHQFSHVGTGAIVSGLSGVRSDVIPFAVAVGHVARLNGINVVGMRRRKYTNESIRAARETYKLLFSGRGKLDDRLAEIEAAFGQDPAVAEIVAFVRSPRSKRPLCSPDRSAEE